MADNVYPDLRFPLSTYRWSSTKDNKSIFFLVFSYAGGIFGLVSFLPCNIDL